MKFSIKNFFSKCEQISRKLRIWSLLLKKTLMKNLTSLTSHDVGTSANELNDDLEKS